MILKRNKKINILNSNIKINKDNNLNYKYLESGSDSDQGLFND